MKRRFASALPLAALLAASLAAPATAAVINGTSGPDVLVGTAQADTMRGYGGADKIYGKAGADWINTGKDLKKDVVYAGAGNDRIFLRVYDHVYAGAGNDTLRVLKMTFTFGTRISCGPGHDTLVMPYGWSVGRPPGCEHVVENP